MIILVSHKKKCFDSLRYFKTVFMLIGVILEGLLCRKYKALFSLKNNCWLFSMHGQNIGMEKAAFI